MDIILRVSKKNKPSQSALSEGGSYLNRESVYSPKKSMIIGLPPKSHA